MRRWVSMAAVLGVFLFSTVGPALASPDFRAPVVTLGSGLTVDAGGTTGTSGPFAVAGARGLPVNGVPTRSAPEPGLLVLMSLGLGAAWLGRRIIPQRP